ncbi:MAG: CehA/McbA family metallohydrolase [Candidatus Methanomethylophilaceae archaeon]|nr:CehA/McbA family metallohydrolase [Candidatus Methanomethylophilaceae archaeon]
MKADLHVHTLYSNDGKTTLEELVSYAVEKGIGCVAVTDHNSFEAYGQLKDNGRVIIVPAEEVSSKEGHIVALGIDRLIPRGRPIQETIDLIHEAGGYAFAAHPYRWWSGLGERNTLSYPFDGIEARNGRSIPSANVKSEALAKRIGKPISAGSDAHTPRHIGEGYVEIPDDVRTWQDVVDAIMAGKATAHSSSRKMKGTLKYGSKSIGEWMLRGFKKMRRECTFTRISRSFFPLLFSS